MIVIRALVTALLLMAGGAASETVHRLDCTRQDPLVLRGFSATSQDTPRNSDDRSRLVVTVRPGEASEAVLDLARLPARPRALACELLVHARAGAWEERVELAASADGVGFVPLATAVHPGPGGCDRQGGWRRWLVVAGELPEGVRSLRLRVTAADPAWAIECLSIALGPSAPALLPAPAGAATAASAASAAVTVPLVHLPAGGGRAEVVVERLLVHGTAATDIDLAACDPDRLAWRPAAVPGDGYQWTNWRHYQDGEVGASLADAHCVLHRFRLAGAAGGRRVVLHLEQSAFVTTVLVDGRALPVQREAFLPIEFDLTPLLPASGTEAEIIIKVQDVQAVLGADGMPAVPIGAMSQWIRGLAAPPRIALRPALQLAEPFVLADVAGDRLEVRYETRNLQPGTAFKGRLRLAVRDAAGAEVLSAAAPVDVAAGAAATGSLVLPCAGRLARWDLGQPVLYRLEASLVDAGGRPLDRLEVRFGFRSVAVAGGAFLLNGRKVRLIGPWAHVGNWMWARGPVRSGEPIRDLFLGLLERGLTCGRLHGQPFNQRFYRAADEAGLLIVAETALSHRPANQAALDHAAAMARQLRNHPSIVLWSGSNEFEHWMVPRPKPTERFLAEVRTRLRAEDPTRPVQHSGFGDALGQLDLCNLHYPEGPGLMDFPRSLGWMADPAANVRNRLYPGNLAEYPPAGRKPVAIGEHLTPVRQLGLEALFGNDWARAVRDPGAEAEQRWKSLAGRFWRDVVRVYRAQDVAMLAPNFFYADDTLPSPFLDELAGELRQVGAVPEERDPLFVIGAANRRIIRVAEDGGRPWTGRLEVRVAAAGATTGACWAEASAAVALEPGQVLRLPVDLALPPAVAEGTAAELRLRLVDAAGAEAYSERQAVRLRRAGLPPIAAGAEVLTCGTRPAVGSLLRSLGVEAAAVEAAELGRALAARNGVLLVGGGVADAALSAQATALARFVHGGGRVLLLERASLPAILPVAMPLMQGQHTAATIGFIRAAGHPLFNGPAAPTGDDLRYWGGALLIADRVAYKPVSGNALTLIDAGAGLEGALLVELPAGAGCYLVSQLRLEAGTGEGLRQPRLILRAAVDYLRRRQPAALAAGAFAEPIDPFARALLERAGWRPAAAAAPAPVLLVDDQGAAALLAEAGRPLPGGAAAVILHALKPERRQALLRRLGVPAPAAAPWPWQAWSKAERANRPRRVALTGVTQAASPLLEGVSDIDLDWQRERVLADTVLAPGSGWTVPLSPGLLAVRQTDGPTVVVDDLPWDREVHFPDRRDRFLATLWGNLGVLLAARPIADAPAAGGFQALPLGPVANCAAAPVFGSALPAGEQVLAGVPLRIAEASAARPLTLLRLNGGSFAPDPLRLPADTPLDRFPVATPDPVAIPAGNRHLAAVHLLVACTRNWAVWKDPALKNSNPVAFIAFRYQDGGAHEQPLRFGVDCDDLRTDHEPRRAFQVGLRFANPANGPGELAVLDLLRLENPHPERKVQALALRTGGNPMHDLIIVAATAQESATAFE